MKARKLIGLKTLNEICRLVASRIPIATAIRSTGIEDYIHARTAYDIVKADIEGKTATTRPEWLAYAPMVQEAPDDWLLDGGFDGKWVHANWSDR